MSSNATPSVGIAAATPDDHSHAKRLAQQLDLPLVDTANPTQPVLLLVSQERLALKLTKSRMHPISVDFLSKQATHRRYHGGGRGQLIARAVGIKSGYRPTVIDATAGLGRDAFVLACLGCQVTMLERSPVLGVMLKDGLMRAQQHADFAQIQLQLVIGDAIDYLARLP